MRLFDDHAFLIFLAFALAMVCYTVIVIAGKPVDERIVGIIAVGAISGLLGLAKSK